MDDSFFRELVSNLAFLTKAQYVFISLINDENPTGHVDIVAFCANSDFLEHRSTECSVHETSCQYVVEVTQELFPEVEVRRMGVENHLVCSIVSSSNLVLGHISIFDTSPFDDKKKLIAIMQTFAVLASSGFERVQRIKALAGQEVLNRNVLENSLDAFVAINTRGEIIRWNKQAEKLFGWTESEVIGKLLEKFIVPEGKRAGHRNGIGRLVKTGKSSSILNKRIEIDAQNRAGHTFMVELTITPVYSHCDEIISFSAFIRDITQQKLADLRLQESENRFRALYDNTPAMFFTIDKNNVMTSVNKFGAEKLGYHVDDLVGCSVMDIILGEDRDNYQANIESCFLDQDNVHDWEIRKVKKVGSIIWGRESARVINNIDGDENLLIVSEDITDAHKLSQQLSYQAKHDRLTDLFNRQEFELRLENLIANDMVGGEEHALCYMDLDQFKVINDTCGHLAGDELLRQLGELFKLKLRKKDTLARLGGDEFGMLIENCSLSQAEGLAQDVRKLVERFHFVWTDKRFSISISIGLVPINNSAGSSSEILSAADAACYAAKEAGRNRVHTYHTQDTDLAVLQGEMQWVSKINRALDEARLRLYLQPIISLKDNNSEQERYECLIRMVDEDGAIIPPGAFLPAAERYDLSVKLDRWVFDSAYAWMENLSDKCKSLISCAINLSGHSLSDEAFLNHIDRKLDVGNVPASDICFEITETVAISRLSNATRFIDIVKKKGCSFALDDFGSGVSSFGYLKNLPVDFLKIDGMFVRDMVDDPIDLAMVKSINEIGHLMGKKTIAEFVENEEILGCLKKLGVDYAQGYHIGKPREIKVPLIKTDKQEDVGIERMAKHQRYKRTRRTD